MQNFIIEQKITPLANRYAVYEATADGQKAGMIAFAQQKRFAFKEQITFYTDQSKTTTAFSVKAENVIDFHGKFIVSDNQQQPVGAVRKSFKASLLRSTWEILDSDGEITCIVRESNPAIAIFRRVWDFIPFASDVPFFIKYHFDFVSPDLQQQYAKYSKTSLLFDHYKLEVSQPQGLQKTNWQTLVAQAVLLDALQGR